MQTTDIPQIKLTRIVGLSISLLAASASGTFVGPSRSWAIVRQITQTDGSHYLQHRVRVRVTADQSEHPGQIHLLAAYGEKHGSEINFSDGNVKSRTLVAPGAVDFDFSTIDSQHPWLIGVSAAGFLQSEVAIDSGGLEIEFILVAEPATRK